jgi:hypothetical protein
MRYALFLLLFTYHFFSLPATPYYDYYHPSPSVLITMHMGTVLVLPHNPLSAPQHEGGNNALNSTSQTYHL